MNNIDYNYYHTKELIAISFSKKANQYFNKEILTDEYFEFLYKKIILNDFTLVNKQMKDNLLELINFIRFNRDLTTKLLQQINELIIKINQSKVSFYQYQGYLEEEFENRKPEERMQLNFLDDNQIDEILSAIEFDFTVLKSLICSEDEYNKLLVTTLSLNEFYFGSINKLENEIPNLFDKYMIRIMEVVAVNKIYRKRNIINYNSKLFRKVVKEGNKLLKKMKN